MNFFEHEMRRLFGDSPVIQDAKYCGKTLIGKVDDELRVKLQFITTGYADHYDSIRMKIINRTEGEVDSQVFKFSDIVGTPKSGTRSIYIWDDRGTVDWYGYHPTAIDYDQISETINDYISMYQDEGMGMTL
jgi:hypothetical protein